MANNHKMTFQKIGLFLLSFFCLVSESVVSKAVMAQTNLPTLQLYSSGNGGNRLGYYLDVAVDGGASNRIIVDTGSEGLRVPASFFPSANSAISGAGGQNLPYALELFGGKSDGTSIYGCLKTTSVVLGTTGGSNSTISIPNMPVMIILVHCDASGTCTNGATPDQNQQAFDPSKQGASCNVATSAHLPSNISTQSFTPEVSATNLSNTKGIGIIGINYEADAKKQNIALNPLRYLTSLEKPGYALISTYNLSGASNTLAKTLNTPNGYLQVLDYSQLQPSLNQIILTKIPNFPAAIFNNGVNYFSLANNGPVLSNTAQLNDAVSQSLDARIPNICFNILSATYTTTTSICQSHFLPDTGGLSGKFIYSASAYGLLCSQNDGNGELCLQNGFQVQLQPAVGYTGQSPIKSCGNMPTGLPNTGSCPVSSFYVNLPASGATATLKPSYSCVPESPADVNPAYMNSGVNFFDDFILFYNPSSSQVGFLSKISEN